LVVSELCPYSFKALISEQWLSIPARRHWAPDVHHHRQADDFG